MALSSLLVRSQDSDIGHILENVVYLELNRRSPEGYVGRYGNAGEVVFVAPRAGVGMSAQV